MCKKNKRWRKNVIFKKKSTKQILKLTSKYIIKKSGKYKIIPNKVKEYGTMKKTDCKQK